MLGSWHLPYTEHKACRKIILDDHRLGGLSAVLEVADVLPFAGQGDVLCVQTCCARRALALLKSLVQRLAAALALTLQSRTGPRFE